METILTGLIFLLQLHPFEFSQIYWAGYSSAISARKRKCVEKWIATFVFIVSVFMGLLVIWRDILYSIWLEQPCL